MMLRCAVCDWQSSAMGSMEGNKILDDHIKSEHTMDGPAEERLERAMQRPLLYIAGPMMSHGNLLLNVRDGVYSGSDAYYAGWIPIIPHMDILYQLVTGEEAVEDYLVRDYAYIKACKAVWFLDGWEKSKGALEEMKLVKAHNIPHFFGWQCKRPSEVLGSEVL